MENLFMASKKIITEITEFVQLEGEAVLWQMFSF